MNDMSNILRPGALYAYQPGVAGTTYLVEILDIDTNGFAITAETLSGDGTETVSYDLPSSALTDDGPYTYMGDVRDHQNNPDVGDVFLWETTDAPFDDLVMLEDPFTAEVTERPDTDRAVIRTTSRDSGHERFLTVPLWALIRHGRWVGHTRPVFDTPERYGR